MDRHTSTQNLRKKSCGEKVNYVKTLVGRSTSAPVTSMGRHTSTKGNCGEGVYKKTLVERGTSAPVTSMDRHTSTKSNSNENAKTGPRLVEVQVHLSRLWTDTRVQLEKRI